jgi:hypothetical protein
MGIWAYIKKFFLDDRSIKEEFRSMIEAEEAQKTAAVNDQITDSVTVVKPKRFRKSKTDTVTPKSPRKKK